MTASDAQIIRIARQHMETTRILGVDFVPLGDGTLGAPSPVESSVSDFGRPVTESADEPKAVGTSDASEDRAAALAALEARHAAECPHCTQATAHTNLVFGVGDPAADLMFIGEAPGAEEDKTGIPFVGRAGQKLNEMIKALGLTREEVYITNILKSRPPNNATPTPLESDRCGAYLREQIAIIKPKVIVSLGKPASNYLLDSKESMTRMRGRWASYQGIPVMPTFHPAYLLRSYTIENRRKVWSDLQQAMQRVQDNS